VALAYAVLHVASQFRNERRRARGKSRANGSKVKSISPALARVHELDGLITAHPTEHIKQKL
jgi:hypothetical protein